MTVTPAHSSITVTINVSMLPIGSSAGTCISQDSSTSVPSCADDPSMSTDNMVNSVDVDLRHGQEHMKNDKIEVYPFPQLENASFKVLQDLKHYGPVRIVENELW